MSDRPIGAATSRGHHESGNPRACGVAGWLALAAAPTFLLMAWLTGVPGDSPGMSCPVMHGASPLSGMLPMYVLMSVFHAGPWLRWITGRRVHGDSR
jgi:hypothetical protein